MAQLNSKARSRLRDRLLEAYGDGNSCNCVFCGDLLFKSQISLDRILPGSLGGTYRFDNVQPTCVTCNIRRGNSMHFRGINVAKMRRPA